jgi:RNA polymerase sigma-70 factor (ECF subfamily)
MPNYLSIQPVEREIDQLGAAQAGDKQAFDALISIHARELHVHCYRMLGSIADADDALQETMLRAWRQIGRFEPRAPFRAWLYRIATNVCLTALEKRTRLNEVSLSGSTGDQAEEGETMHIEPYPDPWLDELSRREPEPEALAVANESIELAFIAAVQHLPPRQRATLLLRDVIGYSAAEVAGMLETTTTGINSALQRARATLDTERAFGRIARHHARGDAPAEERLIHRLVDAWHAADIPAIVSLLTDDALLTMPPQPTRVMGQAAIAAFLSTVPDGGRLGNFRLVPVHANRQPALAIYYRAGDGPHHAYGVLVVSIAGGAIASLTRFEGRDLIARFGLPATFEQLNM